MKSSKKPDLTVERLYEELIRLSPGAFRAPETLDDMMPEQPYEGRIVETVTTYSVGEEPVTS